MTSIRTFHATLCESDAFAAGFRPLSHFGSPRAGLWQVIRKFPSIRDNFPTVSYVYEVEIELGKVLDLPEYDSPNPEALLYAYMEHRKYTFDQYQIWKNALPNPPGSRENDTAAATILKNDGWDTIQYQNVHEAPGIEFLSHIKIGPEIQDVVCWSNLSIEQVEIKGQPHVVPLKDLKPAVEEITKYLHDWDNYPFRKYLNTL